MSLKVKFPVIGTRSLETIETALIYWKSLLEDNQCSSCDGDGWTLTDDDDGNEVKEDCDSCNGKGYHFDFEFEGTPLSPSEVNELLECLKSGKITGKVAE